MVGLKLPELILILMGWLDGRRGVSYIFWGGLGVLSLVDVRNDSIGTIVCFVYLFSCLT